MPTNTLSNVRGFLDPLEPLVLEKLVEELTEARLNPFYEQLLDGLISERRELQERLSQSNFSSLNVVEFERNLDYLVSNSFIGELGNRPIVP
jgi:hypothetical protein